MYIPAALWQRLSKSKFRSRFRLNTKDKNYAKIKGITIIEQHALNFIQKRLAPAIITNDGKQTPMRGHPVFVAQHATATCCRSCLEKWHHFPQHQKLNAKQIQYIQTVIMFWINQQDCF
ncbi:DUF4186 domain-containing protein [Acinetobacter qingfengensis]|uniref:DUF4186 domain-containing protein n=1 Tax=Acinetobacter qingfengensis TaxID=1262585 RepID=A0A1E7RE06_9GAMM|nr:DUF4186 domain-containing protein [Acinetobacter qingfengensis]